MISRREDDINAKTHKLACQGGQPFKPPFRKSLLDNYRLAVHVTALAKSVCKCLEEIRKQP